MSGCILTSVLGNCHVLTDVLHARVSESSAIGSAAMLKTASSLVFKLALPVGS